MRILERLRSLFAAKVDQPPAVIDQSAVECLRHVPTRAQILRLENELRKLPPVEAPITHHFAHGIYAREMLIPAGTILTGKVHKTEHLCIVSKGCITVWTEEGMKTVEAPFTIVSGPGTKRVGYAHTDTVWTAIHGTHERDLGKLEAELTECEGLLCHGAQ